MIGLDTIVLRKQYHLNAIGLTFRTIEFKRVYNINSIIANNLGLKIGSKLLYIVLSLYLG